MSKVLIDASRQALAAWEAWWGDIETSIPPGSDGGKLVDILTAMRNLEAELQRAEIEMEMNDGRT